MRGKNWEALAAVGLSWHCCLESQRAGLASGALWLSSCPSSPPRLLRLLPGGGGALSGRVGDWYVRDGGVIALVRCSGLPGPAFVIPPPRPYLPDLLYNHWKIKPRKEYFFSTASMRGKNWEALAAVGLSWHCCLESQRAGLASGALWLSSCPSSPPRLLLLLLPEVEL